MPYCTINYVDFSQFDAISPVYLGVRVGCVWAPPRTGSGVLITGGDSAGEVFSLWEPSIWLIP